MNLYKLWSGIIAVFAFTSSAYAQEADTIKRKDPGGWEFMQIYVKSNQQLVMEGYLYKGKKDGVWSDYWPSKYPKTVTTYRQGKKDGAHIEFDAEGTVHLVEHYKNDLLVGPRKVYKHRGPVILDEMYSQGKKHGPYTKYYNSGMAQEFGGYVYDVRDGRAIWYHDNGNKAIEYEYKKGVKDGPVTSYYANGSVEETGYYKDDKRSGYWKEFTEAGKPRSEGEYINDEKKGTWKEYDEKGNVKTVTY